MQIFLALALLLPHFAQAKTVHYDLTITQSPVNMSGKKSVDFALLVNGGIPAPTLEFTEGDDAEITVTNNLAHEETSVHWHGILLPPEQDGVPYITTPPILAGASHTFRFKIRQHGTYWYHSHTMVQEQKGIYGAIVIHPQAEAFKADKDVVAVISDWSDEDADQILRNLRKDGDYYQFKKDSVRSYLGAIQARGLGTQLKNEWQRMGGMDLSDLGYDAFLVNGKTDSQLVMAHPGERVRIRLVNAGSSSYFYVSLGGLPFQVIAADGQEIKPVNAREILLGMAETYDIIFTVPDHKNYELRATAQDVTGFASAWIGMGEKVSAFPKPKPDLYMSMDHSMMNMAMPVNHEGMSGMPHEKEMAMPAGHHMNMDMSHMHHPPPAAAPAGPTIEMLTVDELEAPKATAFASTIPVHDVKLVLDGDMSRYIWYINGKTIDQDRNLEIKEGEVVRYTFVNNTMMHHPMHLHGHFFRVLNKNGDRSPLKHTVDVPPHGTRVIEFYADEPGEWMLHCHNVYHMKTGMARIVKYSTFTPNPEISHIQHHDPHMHEHLYWDGKLQAATNYGRAFLRASKTWDTLELEAETRAHDKKWEVEGDLFYRRWFGQYFNLIAGGTRFREMQRLTAGFSYSLPFMIETTALVDHKGDLRFDIERKFQWTKNIFTEGEITIRTHDKPEWDINLMYAPNWAWSAGLTLTEDKVGAGAELRF